MPVSVQPWQTFNVAAKLAGYRWAFLPEEAVGVALTVIKYSRHLILRKVKYEYDNKNC
jgi:hypothetical protein